MRIARNIPFIGGFFDTAEQDALDEINQFGMEVGDLELPDLNSVQYGAATQVTEDPRLMNDQRNYLRKLAYLSEQGFGPEERAAFEAAQNEAAMMAQRDRAAIQENALQRGALGSGAALAMQQGAVQNAANQARQSQLNTASEMAKRKALMTQAYGGALGDVRGQDLQVAGKNADILNRYNELNTDLAWRKKQQDYDNRLQKLGLKGGVSQQRLQNLYGGSAAAGANRTGLQDFTAQVASAAIKGGK